MALGCVRRMVLGYCSEIMILQGMLHGLCFILPRHHTEEVTGTHKRRNGEGECIGRHVRGKGESAIVHLLLPAGIIQVNHFHQVRIAEIRHMRVIEGKMGILPDPHKYDVRRMDAPAAPGSGHILLQDYSFVHRGNEWL